MEDNFVVSFSHVHSDIAFDFNCTYSVAKCYTNGRPILCKKIANLVPTSA